MTTTRGRMDWWLALALPALMTAFVLVRPVQAQEEDTTEEETSDDVPIDEEPEPPSGVVTPTTPEEELGPEEGPPVTYDPEGRRDPFRPLIGPGQQGAELGEEKCEGELRCLQITEVRLTAIIHTQRGDVAMFEGGPVKQGYFAREGDRLKNAHLLTIDAVNQRVIIREELDDPRLLKPYRDHAVNLYREEEIAAASARKF